METGAVAVAGTADSSGARNSDRKNSALVITAASPDLPPSWIPAADSTYTITGVEPAKHVLQQIIRGN